MNGGTIVTVKNKSSWPNRLGIPHVTTIIVLIHYGRVTFGQMGKQSDSSDVA